MRIETQFQLHGSPELYLIFFNSYGDYVDWFTANSDALSFSVVMDDIRF